MATAELWSATIAFDRVEGENQGHIGFGDGVNGGVDPMGMVVDSGARGNRSKKIGHVVFFVKNSTPHLSGEHFSGDGSRRFTEKPSARSGENAGES